MLENCRNARERWGGVSELIDRWLLSRQNLLIIYSDLAAISEFHDDDPDHGERVQEFSEQLVDYVSAGHFEVYEQLLREGREFNEKEGLKEARILLEQIGDSTEQALDFNDKYLIPDDLSALADDLSALGEALVNRFEAEDRIIAVLHEAHRGAAV